MSWMQISARQMAGFPAFVAMMQKGTEMPNKKQKTDAPATPNPTHNAPHHQWSLMVGAVSAQAWMDMGTETIRFIWNRMQHDYKTQKELLACTSLEDMQQVHAAFISKAREQYVDETRKMIDLMGKAATAGIGAAPAARRYDDVPH
ncbi:MAG: phasin family protein [Rhodobacterales bacterium]